MKNLLQKYLAAGGMFLALGLNASATATIMAGSSTVGANAGVGGGASVRAAAIAKIIATAEQRADTEISRRIAALNALSARVNAMAKISASDKTSLSSTISAQIAAMNALQAQIAADIAANSTSSLKTDIQSITKSYRIFALVIPQGAIDAAADRVLDIASSFATLSTQLQTRITAAQNAGNNMDTSVTALADMNAKIADAQTQANAVAVELSSLKPDNGDATVKASNTAALKDARSKAQAGQADLVAARKDAGTIVKALLAVKVSGAASGTTTVSGTTTASGAEQ